MSVIKPEDLFRRKRSVIEEITRDLAPGVREAARRILEELRPEDLMDRRKVIEVLRKRGVIK